MLIPIANAPRAYAWGSTGLIAGLEGRTPTGEPEAEIWYGDHPGCPSHVVSPDGSVTDQTLDAALATAGEAPLPFLLKLLAAASSLSIQAHPTKAQAVAGYAREEAARVPRDADDRLYRDDNHKPEIIVALSDRFEALVGLRPVEATLRLLAALDGGAAIAHLTELLGDAGDEGDEPAGLRAALEWALSQASPTDVAELDAALARADAPEFAAELAVLRAASADFPGDRGLFVALLMNLVVLRRGEGLFAPAGVLHAYQSGLGVELMAASDNVLRGGLTPKHVDVPELLSVLDASPGPAPVVEPRPVGADSADYPVPVPDFALTRVEVSGEAAIALHGPAIALLTAGEVAATDDGGDAPVALRPGRAVYVGGGARLLALSGDGEVFVAQPGIH